MLTLRRDPRSRWRAGLGQPRRRPFRHAAVAVATLCGASLAVASPAVASSPEYERLLERGLAYLANTEDELGVDVAVLLEVLAERTGNDAAQRVASLRRLGFDRSEVAPYSALFGVPKPIVPVRGGRLPAPDDDRAADATEGRSVRVGICLPEAARCEVSPSCRTAVTDPRATGRGLTHQAAWLLFVRWLDCPVDLDLDRLGAGLVRRLRREIAADSAYSETALERLAMLGDLGHADELSPLWWPTIVGAQGGPGCWGVERGGRCHPHPTVLALWALAHLDAARGSASE